MTDTSDDAPNEILATVRDAKAHSEAAARALANRAKNWPLATFGIGVGIGSAAVAGAVLFASRHKRRK